MERRSDDILVAVTRPVRGREMIATTVPTDIFDSMKPASTKRTSRDSDLNKSKTNDVETYYEGYVNGIKYLVPDSNLEAMKDMINLGMRVRRSTRFRHQTSADTADVEMTPERIEKMLAKIRDLKFSMSLDTSVASSSSRKPTITKEERASEQFSKIGSLTTGKNGSILKSLKSSGPKTGSESRSESQKSSSPVDDFSLPESFLLSARTSFPSEYNSRGQQAVPEREEEESDDCYLRLVLSGHFKDNEKPIYIIQEYNKQSNLFSKQSADFTSSQTQGNVHICMAGKLFTENILEETDGKPTSLNLKPNKIIIDASKCKIFRSYFESTYSRKATDITIKGEFLQNERSRDITPYLSLSIQHKNPSVDLSGFSNEEKNEEKRPSILVKNRQSLASSIIETSKDNKRVSFKESSDDEELYVIYKNIKKKNPEDSLPTQVNYAKKEGHLQNRLNESEGSNKHKQIVPKKVKVLERIFFLITENSVFKKFFSKR